MKDLFLRTPQHQFQDYSTSHMHAGSVYQARFRDRPGRSAMWRWERGLITQLFESLAPRRALDFATGTGRIASLMEASLPASELHGIDISADMLAIARSKAPRVAYHVLDGREALTCFGKDAFDLVSAFRFFPNADPELRARTAGQIAELVKPGGYVMLNNHRGFWSIPYVAMRAADNADGRYGSTNKSIEQLFLGRGFALTASYSLGVWPQTDFRGFLLPWPAIDRIERFNRRFLARTHRLGYNTIFVFRRTA